MLASQIMTNLTFDLVLTNAQVLLTKGDFAPQYTHYLTSLDIGIKDGKIAELGSRLAARAAEVVDLKGLTVLPGVIDSQVHFRDPGLTHKEDLTSGTQAAAMGGVTLVFEMPNTKPPTTTVQAMNDKFKSAEGRVWSQIAFYAGATAQNLEELQAMERLSGCIGIKIFMGSSTGNLLLAHDEDILKVLKGGSCRVAVHCEDEDRLIERKYIIEKEGVTVHVHPEWRDEMAALRATQRLVTLARKARRPVHVLHVTTKEEMKFLQTAKDIATVEVTPNHLTLFSPDCYDRIGTFAQMNPPVRSRSHMEALWKGINSHTVDVIGSDHDANLFKIALSLLGKLRKHCRLHTCRRAIAQ
jgi:dihydroorotase